MSGFPAGTVSGAPKIRAMEIINDLENSAEEFMQVVLATFQEMVIWKLVLFLEQQFFKKKICMFKQALV